MSDFFLIKHSALLCFLPAFSSECLQLQGRQEAGGGRLGGGAGDLGGGA